jgi:hypothetical protein
MKRAGARTIPAGLVVLAIWLGVAGWAVPQQTSSTTPAGSPAVVPRLVSFSGAVKDARRNSITGTVDLTFSLYAFQSAA